MGFYYVAFINNCKIKYTVNIKLVHILYHVFLLYKVRNDGSGGRKLSVFEIKNRV